MNEQFRDRLLNREQVRKLVEYANKTVFKHLAVIQTAFSQKRREVYKVVQVTLPEPQLAVGNLQT